VPGSGICGIYAEFWPKFSPTNQPLPNIFFPFFPIFEHFPFSDSYFVFWWFCFLSISILPVNINIEYRNGQLLRENYILKINIFWFLILINMSNIRISLVSKFGHHVTVLVEAITWVEWSYDVTWRSVQSYGSMK